MCNLEDQLGKIWYLKSVGCTDYRFSIPPLSLQIADKVAKTRVVERYMG